MKKKIIIFITLSVIAVLTPFIYVFCTNPLFASKVLYSLKVIDLKDLPQGKFQKVKIVFAGDYHHVNFEVPADKMEEFEINFRKCVQNATSLKGDPGCIPSQALVIQTDGEKYSAYIEYDDEDIIIHYYELFYRGFGSAALRKVFHDAGLKYHSEIVPANKKEANQP